MSREPEDLPHHYPFRLVERAERTDRHTVAAVLGTANGLLTRAEPWPITLVAEAMAQAILLLVRPPRQGSLRLVGMTRVMLHQPLSAGDRLEVGVEELGAFGGLRCYACRALRGGALAAVAEITVSG